MIDTHAHLDDERFKDDLPAVLERAAAANLEHILTIGVDVATSSAAVALTKSFPMLFAVVGIQPNHVAESAANDWDKIVDFAKRDKVVAVGETGLDRHWDRAPFAMQEDFFSRHMELARQIDKPIVIHCREAEADVVRMLKEVFEKNGRIRGVMHSFTGNKETARACLSMGLYISFAGMITYKNSDALRQAASIVPIDRLLVETDSPYLAPTPVRGKRNEPAYILHTAACLASIFSVDFKVIAERTTRNARELFRLE